MGEFVRSGALASIFVMDRASVPNLQEFVLLSFLAQIQSTSRAYSIVEGVLLVEGAFAPKLEMTF